MTGLPIMCTARGRQIRPAGVAKAKGAAIRTGGDPPSLFGAAASEARE